MFLKPEVTKNLPLVLAIVSPTITEPRLNIAVYDSLLDLAERTATEIADLQPRDRIDVQSFIWAVGDYKENATTERLAELYNHVIC